MWFRVELNGLEDDTVEIPALLCSIFMVLVLSCTTLSYDSISKMRIIISFIQNCFANNKYKMHNSVILSCG
jgi:hypothetical protein